MKQKPFSLVEFWGIAMNGNAESSGRLRWAGGQGGFVGQRGPACPGDAIFSTYSSREMVKD